MIGFVVGGSGLSRKRDLNHKFSLHSVHLNVLRPHRHTLRCLSERSEGGDEANTAFREKLTEEEYRVTRLGGTEKRFTGELLDEKRTGTYLCKCCNAELFRSDDKYDSGTGWPSFTAPLSEDKVKDKLDLSNHSFRFEVLCAECEAHLGHHFPDVTPTGLRYCINSVAMVFQPREDVS